MNDLLDMRIKKGVEETLDLIGTQEDTKDTLMGRTYEIKNILEDVSEKLTAEEESSGGSSADEMFVINALLSDDEGLNEWAFRQSGIGMIINNAFNLGSSALALCDTVTQIAANSSAMSAIAANMWATKACSKNSVLAAGCADDYILANGYGYAFYEVGDIVNLTYDGIKTPFRVVHKNYLVDNTIVLVSENILVNYNWHSSNTNNYSSCALRTYLNGTILGKFSSAIQSAIRSVPVSCHNKSTAVTCTDKIWALSFAEVGLGTNQYAPVEGYALDYFARGGANARIKSLNGSVSTWWLRTPYSYNSTRAWHVITDGYSNYHYCNNSNGVVPALVI